jgi:hypothetical protein
MPALEFKCAFHCEGTLIGLRQFFQFRSHKAHRRYTCGTHNVYDSGDHLKFQRAIPPNETRMICPGPKICSSLLLSRSPGTAS